MGSSVWGKWSWGLLVGILLSILNSGAVDISFAVPGVDISRGTVSGVTSTAVGDINRDGLPDIAVFEGGVSGQWPTFAWFEAPNWIRHEFNPSYHPGPFTGDSKLVDINGDGYLDLVLPQDPWVIGSGPASLYWYENPKNSTSPWPRHLIATWNDDTRQIEEVMAADMDGDGKVDVVIRHLGNSQAVRICFQNTPDSWTVRTFPVRLQEGLLLADLDRDGRMDIVLNGFWWAAPSNPRTENYTEYIIDSTFFTQPPVELNNGVKMAYADIDSDGIKDLIIVPCQGQKAYLAWYKCPQNPRTQPWTRNIIENNWGNMHQVLVADFDKNGTLDIAGGLSFGETGIFVWKNNNFGQSWTRQTITSSVGLYYGVLADIGADGDFDIIGPQYYSGDSKPLLYVNLDQSGGGGTTLQAPANLSATALSTSAIRLSWTAGGSAITGFIIQRRTGSGSYSEVARVGAGTTTFDDSSLAAATSYTYRVFAYNSTQTSPASNEATAQTLSNSLPPPPNSPWSQSDIGAVSATGSAQWDQNGNFTVIGSGDDIFGNADEFHFVYQAVQGDGEIVARVTSQNGGSEWAKAGVMIRETLDTGSKHCFMGVTLLHGTEFDFRTSAGASTQWAQGNDTLKPPCWVKLQRAGSTFTSFVSSDGSNWRQINSISMSMAATCQWGLAVSSHQDGTLSTATFDSVAIRASGPALQAPGNLTATALSSSAIRLSWTPGGGAISGFMIQRRSGSSSYAEIAWVGAGTTTFDDSSLVASTSYTYRVFAYNSTQTSPASNEATAQTLSNPVPPPPNSPWSQSDIGAVSAAGSAQWDQNGNFTVTGSGDDIFNGADEFHFVYQAVQGDGEIVARVTSQNGGSEWAKAGVMIRETLDTSSRHCFMGLTRLNGTEFDYRTSAGGFTQKTMGNDTLRPPCWLKLQRSGSTFTSFVSTDGSNWRQINSIFLSMAATCQWGLAVSSHQDGTLSTATFDSVAIRQTSGTAGWSDKDIGAVAVAGRAQWDQNGNFTVTGSGNDIWYSADEFHFVYRAVQGDGAIVARVTSQSGGDSWAKAGVMIRETLDPSSKHCLMELTLQNGTIFDYRVSTGDYTSKFSGNDTLKPPYWVKVQRSGSTFTGLVSANGSNWRQIGSISISMASTCQWGLAVTSHQDGTLSTATFDQVTITPTGVSQLSAASDTSTTAGSLTRMSVRALPQADASASPAGPFEISATNIGKDRFLVLRFTRPSAEMDLPLMVESSTDLNHWTTVYGDDGGTLNSTGSLTQLSRSTQGATEQIVLQSTVPLNQETPSHRFFRASVASGSSSYTGSK